MPKPIVPHRSPAHQFACRALYRALLRQTLNLPATIHSPETREAISEHIVRRFRQDAHLKSPSQITNGLRAGYEALELLHASSHGSSDATQQIHTLLANHAAQNAQRQAYRSTMLSSIIARSSRMIPPKPHPPPPQPLHPSPSPRNVLDDPLPLSQMEHPPSSGRRRVPHFVVTNNVPFLRYHKPQPPALTGNIMGRMKTENHRWKARERIEDLTVLGDGEDLWDRITATTGDASSSVAGSEQPPQLKIKDHSWSSDVKAVDSDLRRKIAVGYQKRYETGERMFEVALKERELADIEKRQRKQEKNRLRLERKKARQEGGGESHHVDEAA